MISALCVLLSALLGTTPATPAPRDHVMAKMILIELSEHGAMNPSGSVLLHGQCKRFQIDSFAAASEGYALSLNPGAALYLPTDHADSEVSGRPMGTCWNMPDPSTGNAFSEVARFDFDPSLSDRENLRLAKAFLSNVRAGDLLQMLATYSSGGRGTHTLLFTQPYDPRTGTLYWSDSNFSNKRIDGERYGFVRAYQKWPLDEFAGWLVKDRNNGATLYRLREDVVKKPE